MMCARAGRTLARGPAGAAAPPGAHVDQQVPHVLQQRRQVLARLLLVQLHEQVGVGRHRRLGGVQRALALGVACAGAGGRQGQ